MFVASPLVRQLDVAPLTLLVSVFFAGTRYINE
jgi:hypothetical protein